MSGGIPIWWMVVYRGVSQDVLGVLGWRLTSSPAVVALSLAARYWRCSLLLGRFLLGPVPAGWVRDNRRSWVVPDRSALQV